MKYSHLDTPWWRVVTWWIWALDNCWPWTHTAPCWRCSVAPSGGRLCRCRSRRRWCRPRAWVVLPLSSWMGRPTRRPWTRSVAWPRRRDLRRPSWPAPYGWPSRCPCCPVTAVSDPPPSWARAPSSARRQSGRCARAGSRWRSWPRPSFWKDWRQTLRWCWLRSEAVG